MSIKANLRRAEELGSFKNFDPETQIHGNHITSVGASGNWKRLFTPAIELECKTKIGEYLIELGYEKHFDWSV